MKSLNLSKNQWLQVVTVLVMIAGIYFAYPAIQQTNFGSGDLISREQNHSGSGDNVGQNQYNNTIVYEATSSLAETLRAMEEGIANANQIANAAMYASIVGYQDEISCSSVKMVNRLPISVYSLNDAYFRSFGASMDQEGEDFEARKGLTVIERGFVYSRDTSGDGTRYLTIKKNRNDFFSVACFFESEWTKAVDALEVGKEVNFCGTIGDFLVGVRLTACELME